jgi:hypothetical protein
VLTQRPSGVYRIKATIFTVPTLPFSQFLHYRFHIQLNFFGRSNYLIPGKKVYPGETYNPGVNQFIFTLSAGSNQVLNVRSVSQLAIETVSETVRGDIVLKERVS